MIDFCRLCAFPRCSTAHARIIMDHPVDRDGLELVKRFAAKKSNKFEDFKSEWLNCSFYFMHCIGKDAYTKSSIIERLQAVMIGHALLDSVEFYERLGSIYLCYSLYCTQLNADCVKIRITLTNFNGLQSFHTTLRSRGIHDADYILCKLKSFSAFMVCTCQTKKCMGQQTELISSELNAMSDQLGGSRSDQISKYDKCYSLLQDYQQLKRSISLHLPSHLTEVSDILDSEKIQLVTTDEQQQETDPTTQDGEADEAARRTRLRRKQYRKPPRRIAKLRK